MLPKVKNLILASILVLVLSVVLAAVPGCKSAAEPVPEATPEVAPEKPAPAPETPELQTSTPQTPEPETATPEPSAPGGLILYPGEPLTEKRLDVEKVYSGGDEPGFCYLGSYAMLAKFADDTIEFTEVIASSGVGASAVYIPEMNLLMNGYSIGSVAKAAVNQGFDYYVAGLEGAQLTDEFFAGYLTEDASLIALAESTEKAFNLMKRVISSDIPVMVHLDINFIKDALIANTSYMYCAFAFAGEGHLDHYVTVTGYDEEYVYLNDPTESVEGMGKDIPANISDFLSAWENGANPALEEGSRMGPCWMLFLGERGMAKTPEELVAWNKDIAARAPGDIRKAAERPNIMPLIHCSEMGRARYEFGMFLKENGYEEAGEIFLQISKLFQGLDISPNQRGDMERIADLQEEALGKF